MKYKTLQFLSLAFGLLVLATFRPLSAQVIWSEPFTYPNGTTVGANNNTANPALDWTSACPSCVITPPIADWFEVQNNIMEGRDVNGLSGAAWLETETIDISAYPAGVEVSIYFEETGDLEGCPGGISTGCNSIDWIRVEYKLDNAPYQDWSSPMGGACAGACAGATYVVFDDFGSFTFVKCPIFGDSLKLRISMMCWAGSEYLRVDNITISGQTCQPVVAFDSLIHNNCFGDTDGEIWINAFSANSPFTYSLNGNPFQSSNSFTGLAAGTYTVIVQDNIGQYDTLSNLVITQPQVLNLGVSIMNISCNGFNDGQIQAINTSGGTPPYLYSLNGGTPQSNPLFPGLGPGSYSLVMTDSLGCIDSVSGSNIIDPPQLSLSLAATPTACSPPTGTVTATISGGTPGISILWNTVPAQFSAQAIGLAGGVYTVLVTDTNGCTITDSATVAQPLVPGVTAGPGDTICLGQGGVQLTSAGTGGSGILTYAWWCDSSATPCNLSNPALSNPIADPTSTTWYYVQVTDTNNCQSNLDSALVWIESVPIAYAGPDTILCEGDSLQLLPEVFGNSAATFTFLWSDQNGILNPGGEDTITIYPIGVMLISLIATPSFGCPSLPDQVLVEAEEPFVHDAPEDVDYCPGEPLWIGVDSMPGFDYTWNPVTGLMTPNASWTQVSPNETLNLLLSVTSQTKVSENCKVQDFSVIVSLGDCELPNVVTPNGDGANDFLDLSTYFNQVKIHIFDRWGKLIYSDANYQNDWGGTNSSGEPLSEGVYFYTVEGDWIGTGHPEADVSQYSRGHHLTLLR